MPSPSKLSEVIKLELIENKKPDEIAEIWMEYHADPAKKQVATVLPADQFLTYSKNASLSRMFVLPLGKAAEPPQAAGSPAGVPAGSSGTRDTSAQASTSGAPRPPQPAFLSVLVQQQMPFTLVSTVEEFRRFGPQAPAHLVLTHYRELSHTKGLVLVRGDVVSEGLISVQEARTLMALIHAFYTDPEYYNIVRIFNHEPSKFNFDDLTKKLGF